MNFSARSNNNSIQYYILAVIGALIFGFTVSSAKGFNINHNHTSDSIAIKAKKLKQLYVMAMNSSNSDYYKQQFFNEFPNTFKELNELYGYDFNTHKSAPLESDVETHIYNLFNNLNNIDKVIYYKKLVSIALGGHWDADAVNIFQDGLRQRVLADLKLTVDILKVLPDDKIRSFWHFYFDGAHPERQIPEQLQKIKSIDNKIYNLMIEAHTQMVKKWKDP